MARRGAFAAALSVLVCAVAAGFYPEDHFSYVTKLTTDNFESEIQKAIDADKTMFVRWIASEG